MKDNAWPAGCTGTLAFTSVQLTTLGNNGPNGPTSVDGYITTPCPDLRSQLVQSGALAIAPNISGVQQLRVPVNGTYLLNITGECTKPLKPMLSNVLHTCKQEASAWLHARLGSTNGWQCTQ